MHHTAFISSLFYFLIKRRLTPQVIFETLRDLAQEASFECVFPPAKVEAGRVGVDVPVEFGNLAQFGAAICTEANFARANPQRNPFHASQVRRPFVFSLFRDAFTVVFPTPLLPGNFIVQALNQLSD